MKLPDALLLLCYLLPAACCLLSTAAAHLLMVKMDERFDAMEAAQARREQERLAYLLKNAELLGGVCSTSEMLTGQLATLAAKLDRQVERAK